MARQQGIQYEVPWDNIMDDRIYNKKDRTGTESTDHADSNTGTFGRRSTNSNRTHRNSDYLQLMDYQVGGSQYSLSDPSQVYDNTTYPREQFPAGRYKKHRTYSEATSSERCGRPFVIATIVVVVVLALGAATVGLYFGVFKTTTTQTTPSPDTLTAYATEFRLTDQTWDPRLADPNSPQFDAMKADVQSDLTTIMSQSSLKSKYQSVEVSGFSQGSIKVECVITLLVDDISPQDVRSSLIQSYIAIAKVNLKVAKAMDTTTISITLTQPTTTGATTSTTSTTTTTTTDTTPTTKTTTPTTTSTTSPTTTTTTTPPTTTTTTPTTTTTTTPTTTTPTTTTTTSTTTTTTPTTTTPTTTTTPITTTQTTTTPTTTTTTTPTTTTPTTTTTTTTTTTPTTTTTTPTTTTTTPTTTTTTPTTTTSPTTTTPTTTTTTPTTTTTTPTTTTSPTTTTPTTTTTTPTTTTTTPTTTTTTPTTTTTTPTTTTTTPSTTTKGLSTPPVCRNTSVALQLLFQCFDLASFQSLTTDDEKCEYLSGVGNCLQGKIETTYGVTCAYSDQIFIINSFAALVTSALQFDLMNICNF
ncbi:mucin-2-like [Argopecten irradians]|uniref:mucin-2-like n=1 Tax=Argopecten irradians TaxID=31199 RepID=UPI003712B52F